MEDAFPAFVQRAKNASGLQASRKLALAEAI